MGMSRAPHQSCSTQGNFSRFHSILGVSAAIGAIYRCFWAKARAFEGLLHIPVGCRTVVTQSYGGWTMQEASWSTSQLRNAHPAVSVEPACCSQRSASLVLWDTPCSKIRSAPQAEMTMRSHSRTHCPPSNELVPHTPLARGGRRLATALCTAPVHALCTRGVRAVHTDFPQNPKVRPC